MNKRRSFLQQLGLLTAGFVAAPALVSCSSSDKPAEEAAVADTATGAANADAAARAELGAIGIQLYTLREQLPKDVKGVIGKVAQAGYKDVETYGYSKEGGFWGLEPKAFKELLQANGLVSTSGHYDFMEYIKTGNTELLQPVMEAAAVIGNKYVTVPWLAEELRNSAEDYKLIAERINKAGQLVKDAGMQLAYHNHDFEFNRYGDTTGYKILLNETDPELVKYEADLYWFARAGEDPLAYFKAYPGRFVMWHVKDMDKNSPDLNTEIGNGSINYKQIFAQAGLAGVQRVFVEQEDFAASMDPFQSIAQSHDYVKNRLI